jgi:hypothetical protein
MTGSTRRAGHLVECGGAQDMAADLDVLIPTSSC